MNTISQEKRDFYQYYATMMEPWDGPASILFSDGDVMGAVLDRNGLRPSRYYITSDGYMILVFRSWRYADSGREDRSERASPSWKNASGRYCSRENVSDDNELKEKYAKMQPYGEWLNSNLVQLKDIKIPNIQYGRVQQMSSVHVSRRLLAILTNSTVHSIRNMALNGAESIGAMGVDTPLAVLSKEHQSVI